MSENTSSYNQAVVIGSSIAGLTAARVLADHFQQVTIVERDRISESAKYRRGVPQARHAHTLLPQGQMILEHLFPGLVDELVDQGAVLVAPYEDTAFFHEGQWRKQGKPGLKPTLSGSRPLLETALYKRVAALPNITFYNGYEVQGLTAESNPPRVTGVRLRNRSQHQGEELILPANLVVDASGRQSKAPGWLEELGCLPPEEWTINPQVGYATRIYRMPENFEGNWKSLYIRPTAPDSPRGGVIVPMENGRWHVTLIGVCGDYPPTTDEEFLAFARSLPTPALYEAIKDAEPLSKPGGFRRTANRVRRYDRLPDYLEGFLVSGDAAYALNPLYAQGMTAAIIGSRALEQSLRRQKRQRGAGVITGLAASFQTALSQAVGRLWQISTQKDWLWPLTEITDNTEQLSIAAA